MFNTILRKVFFRDLSKEEQEIRLQLQKGYFSLKIIINLVLFCLFQLVIPITILIIESKLILEIETKIIVFLMTEILYTSFIIWITIKYEYQISDGISLLARFLYGHFFATRGKALSKSDLKKIKEKNKKFYNDIVTVKCNGFCYNVCFYLLKYLGKGELKFVAIKDVDGVKCENYYTMHVLYVRNNWCYDTFSCRQHPLDKVLRAFDAKEYKTFTYKDVEEKTYAKFRYEQYSDLKRWCFENDCSQFWGVCII